MKLELCRGLRTAYLPERYLFFIEGVLLIRPFLAMLWHPSHRQQSSHWWILVVPGKIKHQISTKCSGTPWTLTQRVMAVDKKMNCFLRRKLFKLSLFNYEFGNSVSYFLCKNANLYFLKFFTMLSVADILSKFESWRCAQVRLESSKLLTIQGNGPLDKVRLQVQSHVFTTDFHAENFKNVKKSENQMRRRKQLVLNSNQWIQNWIKKTLAKKLVKKNSSLDK